MSFTTLSGRRLAYGRKHIEWLAIEIERGTVARLSAPGRAKGFTFGGRLPVIQCGELSNWSV